MKRQTFNCKYCKQEKPIEELDYDAGLTIAHIHCFQALGHTVEYPSWKN